MTTTRAAKYLAAVDLGKTITVTDTDTDKTVTGELQSIEATDCSDIQLSIIAGKDSGTYHVANDEEVTLQGQPSPPTDDPHGLRAKNAGKPSPILDLSTPENKVSAREALPALLVGGMLGNQQASRAAGEIIADAFADVIKPSIEALQRLQARKDQ